MVQRRQIPMWRKALYSLMAVLVVYGAAELVTSYIHSQGAFEPRPVWILEKKGAGSSISFDPVRGYRLTRTNKPRLVCVLTDGRVGSIGVIRGNNEGFPDRDDHQAKRPGDGRRRYAVFGRSYTAAQFVQMNWPDRAERAARQAGHPVQLMNMSIDGGALMNWWSVIKRHLERKKYELDGVVFSINFGNIYAGFTTWDDSVDDSPLGQRCLAQGFIESFDPKDLPATLEQAMKHTEFRMQRRIMPPDQIDRILKGDERVPFDAQMTPFLFGRLAHLVRMKFRVRWGLAKDEHLPPEPPAPPPEPEGALEEPHAEDSHDPLEEARRKLAAGAAPPRVGAPVKDLFVARIKEPPGRPEECDDGCIARLKEIREFLVSRKLRSLVVAIPGPALHEHDTSGGRWFAHYMGASWINGAHAFDGLPTEMSEVMFIPHEGHWNQAGSDQFARFMAEVLPVWEAATPAGAGE